MKVIYLKNKRINELYVKETRLPAPNSNEILVRINAVALNYRDLLIIKNGWAINPKIPFAASSAGAGIVEETGKDVALWKKGDRVTTHFFEPAEASDEQSQFIAGYVAIPEKAAAAIPYSLTDEEAAALSISGLAAWIALAQKARVRAGHVVVLQGTGGTSLLALQLAKASGAYIIALTGKVDKIEKLKLLGADQVINYNEVPEWYQQVMDITKGIGADVILDVVGSATISQSMKAVKEGGFIASIGQLSGSEAAINLMDLIMKGIRLQGIIHKGDITSSGIDDLYAFVTTYQVKPVVDKVFRFDQVIEALDYLDTGHAFGKIIIKL
jgi:NADPH:quinone reductase-like Zn-dependent oxidoreductase